MNKSFLSVSPSEGNGNAQVVINVKENMSLDERSESLRIRTGNGVEKCKDYSGSWYDLLPYYASIWHPGGTR